MTVQGISVLMPVYNTAPEYLSQAVESILSQTFTRFELLIYDDGSTRKETLDCLEQYAAADSRIRVIHAENGGVAHARNRLMEEAVHSLCAIMDSDDIAHPRRLEKQVTLFERCPDVGICGTWYRRFPSETEVCLPTVPGFLDFLKENCLGNSTVMFNKDLLSQYGLRFDESLAYCEDYDLYSRAVRFLKIVNIPEILLEYRERPDSLCHANLDAVHDADWYIHRRMLDFLTGKEGWPVETSRFVGGSQPSGIVVPKHLPMPLWKRIIAQFRFPVVVRLMGGLGNQMFQFAFGCALAVKKGRRLQLDLSWIEEASKTFVNQERRENADGVVMRLFALDVFRVPLPVASAPMVRWLNRRKIVEPVERFHRFDVSLLQHRAPGLWQGYFQNEAYFSSLKPYLKKAFSFPLFQQGDTFNQMALLRIRLYEHAVFVHVRGGDSVNLGWALPASYYSDAAAYMVSKVPDAHFFVFGDYQEPIDQVLRRHASYVDWIGNHNAQNKEDWKDMALMMHCRHAIVANSSFSWWAAWLGEADKGTVVAPSPFLDGTDEGICASWIKIPR